MSEQILSTDDPYRLALAARGPIRRFRDNISKFFFGDDIFVSYARADATAYAASLAARLTKRKFICYLDQFGSLPEAEMPVRLKDKLMRSTALVLVGTPRAVASVNVRKEIALFTLTKRPIIPLNVDDVLLETDWADLNGLAKIPEAGERVRAGNPSPKVINLIKNSFRYRRRNQWQRFFLFAGAAFVVLAVGSASLWAGNRVAKANEVAATSEKKAGDAETKAASATVSEGKAKEAALLASLQEVMARVNTGIAAIQQKLAETGMEQAQLLELQAKERAAEVGRQEAGQRATVLSRVPGREFDALDIVAKTAHEDFRQSRPAPQVISGLVAAVSAVEDGLPLRGVQGEVTYVQISSDAKTLFVEMFDHRDNKVRWSLWNAQTGEPRGTKPLFEKSYEVGPTPSQFHRGQSKFVRSTSFSPNSTRLAVVEETSPYVLHVWDLTDEGKPVSTNVVLENPSVIALDNDGQRLAMLSSNFQKLELKNLKDGTTKSFENPFSFHTSSLAFGRDNKLTVFGESQPDIPKALQEELQGNNIEVLTNQWNGGSFKGLSSDGLPIFLFDPRTKGDRNFTSDSSKIYVGNPTSLKSIFSGYDHGVAAVAVAGENPYVVSIDGGKARIYGVREDAPAVLREHPGTIDLGIFSSPDGSCAATVDSSSSSTVITIWNSKTGRPLHKLNLSERLSNIHALAFSADATRVGIFEGSLVPKVWDVKTGKDLTPTAGECNMALDGRGGDVAIWTQPRAVVFLPGNRRVLTMHRFGTVALWELGNLCKPLVHTLDRDSTVVAISADGSAALTVGNGDKRQVKIWDLSHLRDGSAENVKPTSTDARTIPRGDVRAAWVQNGKARILLVQNDWTAAIWRSDAKTMGTLNDFAEQIHSATFSDNGTTLALVTKDSNVSRSVSVWDSLTSEKLITIPGDFEVEYSFDPVKLSPDGSWLMVANRDHSARIYPTTKEGFLEVAARMLGRGSKK